MRKMSIKPFSAIVAETIPTLCAIRGRAQRTSRRMLRCNLRLLFIHENATTVNGAEVVQNNITSSGNVNITFNATDESQ